MLTGAKNQMKKRGRQKH